VLWHGYRWKALGRVRGRVVDAPDLRSSWQSVSERARPATAGVRGVRHTVRSGRKMPGPFGLTLLESHLRGDSSFGVSHLGGEPQSEHVAKPKLRYAPSSACRAWVDLSTSLVACRPAAIRSRSWESRRCTVNVGQLQKQSGSALIRVLAGSSLGSVGEHRI